jgi:ribosomal protein S3AE
MAEKKKFIETRLPLINSETRVLGSVEELKGKTIKLDLTRKLRGKGLNVKFKIFEIDGELIGIPYQMELIGAYIRRMMRKRADYVEDSFKAQCADIRVTIKPFLITRKRVSRAVRRNLRNTTREFLVEYIKDKDYNTICDELIDGDLQKLMLPKLKKVYPLSLCDIRVFETKELDKIDVRKVSDASKKKEKSEAVEEIVESEVNEEVEEDSQVEEESKEE